MNIIDRMVNRSPVLLKMTNIIKDMSMGLNDVFEAIKTLAESVQIIRLEQKEHRLAIITLAEQQKILARALNASSGPDAQLPELSGSTSKSEKPN